MVKWHRVRPAVARGAMAALVLGTAAPAGAQDEAATTVGGWTFGLTPYIWFAGLKGDVGISGLQTASVDASFSDIIDNKDFVFMLAAEARHGRFAVVADLSYLSLSADATTPGPLFGGVNLDQTTFFASVVGFYRIAEDERFSLDLGAGARIWYVENELSLRAGLLPARRVRDDDTWVDPLIGLRGTAELGRGFALAGAADIGGAGVASDLTWQLLGTIDYRFSDRFTVRAGYRHLKVDYEKGGFVWDVSLSGPILGGAIRF